MRVFADSNSVVQQYIASVSAYWQLTKPNVVALLVFTAGIGMLLADHSAVSGISMLGSLLGMGLAMMSAAAINQILDQRADAVMARTQRRPLVKQSISNASAIFFALTLCMFSILLLEVFANRLTTMLTIFGVIGYAFIYTLYLKRATPQNIVIGGWAGAIPPLLGWAAVSNDIHPYALLLVLIIFAWTPPHFWALAIYRRAEYEKAGIPVLSVTHGVGFTKTATLLYSVLLAVSSLLPYITGMSGGIYLFAAGVLNTIFLWFAVRLKLSSDNHVAIKMFNFSIVYLGLLFAGLLIDHYLS